MHLHLLPMSSLSGQVAIITGSSRSIGAAIARRLADDGANVVINYANNANAADHVVQEINAKRAGAAIAIKADVSSIAAAKSLLDETIKAFGRIDFLVLNAGIMGSKVLSDIDEEVCLVVILISRNPMRLTPVRHAVVLRLAYEYQCERALVPCQTSSSSSPSRHVPFST